MIKAVKPQTRTPIGIKWNKIEKNKTIVDKIANTKKSPMLIRLTTTSINLIGAGV